MPLYATPPGDKQPFDGYPAFSKDVRTDEIREIGDYRQHARLVVNCRNRHDEQWVQIGENGYFACINCMTMAYR